jgi:hypothetical protein
MYRYIQKPLDWGVKIASLAVTAPATWIVATRLFADVESPLLLFVMRFAAVFLIEGVLLSNWLLLEFDRNATPEIKARYGLTALAMYISLLVIAWEHEGPTGLVFRVALLAALIGSGWDTYVYTWQRATSRVDRSAENSAKVRRHARKLSINEAITQRNAEHDQTLALIEAENRAILEDTSLYGQRRLTRVQVDHQAEQNKILEDGDRLLAASNGNGRKKVGRPSLRPALTGEVMGLDDEELATTARSREDLLLRPSIRADIDPDELSEEPSGKPANGNRVRRASRSRK